jgi:uncharacterized membrane protein
MSSDTIYFIIMTTLMIFVGLRTMGRIKDMTREEEKVKRIAVGALVDLGIGLTTDAETIMTIAHGFTDQNSVRRQSNIQAAGLLLAAGYLAGRIAQFVDKTLNVED